MNVFRQFFFASLFCFSICSAQTFNSIDTSLFDIMVDVSLCDEGAEDVYLASGQPTIN